MTKEQVLEKLTSICAKAEYCLDDMRKKMYRWQVEEQIQEEVLDFLLKEQYIDEERYCAAFISDKIKFNRWGRNKVKQALYQKHIPQSVYQHILDEFPEDEYEEILIPLLKEKSKTIKADSEYEFRGKLIRFAMQRGFTYEQIERCLDKL